MIAFSTSFDRNWLEVCQQLLFPYLNNQTVRGNSDRIEKIQSQRQSQKAGLKAYFQSIGHMLHLLLSIFDILHHTDSARRLCGCPPMKTAQNASSYMLPKASLEDLWVRYSLGKGTRAIHSFFGYVGIVWGRIDMVPLFWPLTQNLVWSLPCRPFAWIRPSVSPLLLPVKRKLRIRKVNSL